MLFRKILVALDGSEYSQIAAEYAFWLADMLKSQVDGLHVVDPRIVDYFVAPEFAEALGFAQSIETSEKVFTALKKIGTVILELFAKQCQSRGQQAEVWMDVGYVVEEIVKRTDQYQLVITGHRGRTGKKLPAATSTGTIADRVAAESDCSVLVAVKPVNALSQILVAYDGSEPARSALLAGEQLSLSAGLPLKALIVAPQEDNLTAAQLIAEQGMSYLRLTEQRDLFFIQSGSIARTLLEYANQTNSLLVVGASGGTSAERAALGSTASYIVRRTRSSILIIR